MRKTIKENWLIFIIIVLLLVNLFYWFNLVETEYGIRGGMGYLAPAKYKKELKGKIKYFDYLAINDLNSRWGKDKWNE